tara:strand:- start:27 stop:278 length:252 start_codon:yes stop_codon:yes gene_type:complete
MCFGLFDRRMPDMPKPLLAPPEKKAPEPEVIKEPEKLIDEEDTTQKVKTSSKKSNVLLSKGSPASKFTSPIPGSSTKSGGINV